MIHVQTGSGIDVIIEDGKMGLYPHDAKEIIWLSDPEALLEVLAAELKWLKTKEKNKAQAF